MKVKLRGTAMVTATNANRGDIKYFENVRLNAAIECVYNFNMWIAIAFFVKLDSLFAN